MAITVVTRPIGHKLSETPNTATITSSYSGTDGFFVKANHGLVDGDYIYAASNIENYNGFWYVDKISTDAFKLKDGVNGSFVDWVANGSITYYVSTSQHGWSCVHLPIVYKLSSNAYPTNSVDTARTVSSFSDDNGYVNLNLSGTLHGGTLFTLDYIEISGATDDSLNGVFQITDAVSSSDITIALAYDAGYSFTGATVNYYYKNYHVKVKLFGGLAETHQFEYLKPYEELGILNLIPDEDGVVMFSVNDYLKSQIETRNNTLLASLPVNMDFFTMFYIETAEAYDESDGSVVSAYISEYTSDQENFEGFAVNAQLAFKNMYSGTLTEYIMNSTTAKFLTLFSIPVLFAGCEQDVSFIKDVDRSYNISPAYQQTSGVGADWTTDVSSASVTVTPGSTLSEVLYKPSNLTIGSSYTFYTKVIGEGFYTAGGGNALSVILGFYDASFVFIDGESILSSSGTDQTTAGQVTTTVPVGTVYIGVQVTNAGLISGSYFVRVTDLEMVGTDFYVEAKKYLNGDLQATEHTLISGGDPGVYRHFLTADDSYDEYVLSIKNEIADTEPVSEELSFTVDNTCTHQSLMLTWLNNLGGFDYWNFTAKKDHLIEITESGTTKQNIFPQWPQSYGTTADTIRKQTFRTSNKAFTVRSQLLTQAQLDSVAYIKSSILVQIVSSRSDRRTVIVDDGSFVVRADRDDTYSIAFNISFTDDIPAQRV